MKNVYIPKGETVTYDQLNTLSIVVKGTLIVKGKLTASFIQGGGRVESEEIQCDTIEVGTVQAEILTARKVVGKKLFVRDLVATDAVMATDFIESLHVLTKSLFITLSSISQCDAEEIIMLSQKKRGLLGMLFASNLRSIWISMFHSKDKGTEKQEESPVDENIEPEIEDTPQKANGFDKELVSEIMQYLGDNGYLKMQKASHKQPDINVEYCETEASFRTDFSAIEGAGSDCEEVA